MLRITGIISDKKRMEFNQSMEYMMDHLPDTCKKHFIASDLFDKGRIYFQSQWLNKEDILEFLKMDEYKAFVGAFKTLGDMKITELGEWLESETLRYDDLAD